MEAFNVYLNGKLIDTILYHKSNKETCEEVKRSLVNHDGYDPSIVVKKMQVNNGKAKILRFRVCPLFLYWPKQGKTVLPYHPRSMPDGWESSFQWALEKTE